jgi:hypothetical protein
MRSTGRFASVGFASLTLTVDGLPGRRGVRAEGWTTRARLTCRSQLAPYLRQIRSSSGHHGPSASAKAPVYGRSQTVVVIDTEYQRGPRHRAVELAVRGHLWEDVTERMYRLADPRCRASGMPAFPSAKQSREFPTWRFRLGLCLIGDVGEYPSKIKKALNAGSKTDPTWSSTVERLCRAPAWIVDNFRHCESRTPPETSLLQSKII